MNILTLIVISIYILMLLGMLISCGILETDNVIFYIKNKKQRKQKIKKGYHLIKKSELPADTKEYLWYQDFIEEIDLTQNIIIDSEEYNQIKTINQYCNINKIKCNLPVLIDDVIDDEKILTWLKENGIYTKEHIVKYDFNKTLNKPEFEFERFQNCKYLPLKNLFSYYWYNDNKKLNELKQLACKELQNNNFYINSLSFEDAIHDCIMADINFKKENENTKQYKKLRKELFDFYIKLFSYEAGEAPNEYLLNCQNIEELPDILYMSCDYEYEHDRIDYLEIIMDYEACQFRREELYIKKNGIIRANILAACNKYYAENYKRNLLIDANAYLHPVIKAILFEINNHNINTERTNALNDNENELTKTWLDLL